MRKIVFIVALLAAAAVAQAAMQTYSIVDYPAYQLDTITGLTDHVSGTIVADPATGVIVSATFTLTGASSYTVASAVIDPYFVHISPTQITLSRINPSNPMGYGNLRLSGATQVSGFNAALQWYAPGDPLVPGSMNYASYMGQVYLSKNHPVDFGTAGGLGDSYPWVIANVVPEPSSLIGLAAGLITLAGLRRRRA